jgi:lamin tail-like protein
MLRPGQYYLVANNSSSGGYSDTSVPANLSYGTGISDTGGIALIKLNSSVSDQVGMSSGSTYKEGTILSPLAGTSDQSYERKLGGASDSCQDTNDNANDFSNRSPSNPHNYSSPLSLCGVAGPTSLITTTTTITADTPDPSLVSGLVTVSVTVSVPSGATVATGTINITGANTNCSINLTASSAGKGSCSVIFTSAGSKGLAATYIGDNTHAASSDTEAHSVTTTATAVRTRTPQPTPLPPPPLIGLNEFVPRPGHDWNNDGVINTGDEYIELINHGVIDVNLSGYSLDDEVNIGSNPFSLPSITLKPGERHVFYGSETGLLLGDGGDGVRLLKSNGQLADAYNYSVVRFPDQSYCRLPDNGGLDDWNQNCFPTPGLQNSLSGSAVNPPTENGQETLCPISDTLPDDFVIAECLPFGNNIWNSAYWDKFGWFDGKYLPESPGKWPLFAE